MKYLTSILATLAIGIAVILCGQSCAEASGTSATLSWVMPTSYIDNTALPASDIASTTITWYRPNGTTAVGSVTVAAPAITTVVNGLVCGNFNFVARVTTAATAAYPSSASSDSSPPTAYATGVNCAPNPPTGLTAK